MPLAFVAAARMAAKPLAEDGGFAQDLLMPDAAADWLYALQVERVRRLSVTVKEVRAKEILVDFTGTERTLPLERVYGMVFAQRSGAPPPAQALPLVRATNPDGTPRKLLSVDRLRALGWRSRIGLREGIASTFREYAALFCHASPLPWERGRGGG